MAEITKIEVAGNETGYYLQETKLSNFVFKILQMDFDKGKILIEIFNGFHTRYVALKRDSLSCRDFAGKCVIEGRFVFCQKLTKFLFDNLYNLELDNYLKKE